MRLIICCVVLNSVLFTTFSQTATDTLAGKADYIINRPTYKKGIYRSFSEFKYDSPSIAGDLTFDGKRLRITLEAGEQNKIRKREIWGFSDGKRVFVKWNRYNEVMTFGRYCYFEEKGIKIVTFLGIYPPFIVPIPLPYRDRVIINYNTGKPFKLTNRLMKKILKTDDPELLKQFMNEPMKKQMLATYILKYNSRNQSKIK